MSQNPPLSVAVLGCAGSYPPPGNACSGYLVQSPGATVVVDLGPGTLANLQRHVALGDVSAVVLTHEHPDHWLDLPILRNAMRYYLGLEGLEVYSTGGVHDLAQTLIGELPPTLVWTTIDGSSRLEIGDLTLAFSTTDHPVETLAVRIESAGRSLVYTADTGPGWSGADEFAARADLLLSEATLPTELEGEGPHLSGRQAGELARRAEARRLVLTHIAPEVDADGQRAAAAREFDGPVELAQVGERYLP